MNDIEARLRDAYRAAAATVSETTRELGEQTVTISAPTGPTSWRSRGRIMIPLAAAAAVAVTSVVLPGVLAGSHRHGHQTAAGQAPRFVAQLDTSGPSALGSLVIRDIVTGASVASITAPAPRLQFYAIATGDGTHFVADVGRDGGCGSWFYQFQLNGAGQPSALTPYKLAFVRQSVATIALSQDNGTFAYLGQPCPNSRQAHAWLSVLSVQTMRTSRWELQPAEADAAMPLALTANGGLLAYGIARNSYGHSGIYMLRTSAAPGPALQRSRKMATAARFGRSSNILGYAIRPDGSALYIQTEVSLNNYASGHSWQIRVIDLATGRIRLIRQFPGADTSTWTPDWSVRRALAISVTIQNAPYTPAPVRFLVINLVTGRVLRSLPSGPWDPTNSLFSW